MPEVGELLGELGSHAGGLEVALEVAVLVDAHAEVEQEDVLEGDDVALHALHLGDVGDAAGAVTQAGEVHDEVERRGHLLADGPHRQVEAGHERHRLDAGQRVARAVGVDRGDRAVVAGVHGLEHVEGLAATALADDDAVGPHAQAVADEVADGDLALALDVRRAGLQGEHVVLVELELLGVLDGDDALVGGDERRQHVEGRRLAGAGAAGDDHVEAADHAGLQEAGRVGVERAEPDQVVDLVRVLGELPDGEERARRSPAGGSPR